MPVARCRTPARALRRRPGPAAGRGGGERLEARRCGRFLGRRPQKEVEDAFARAACVASAVRTRGIRPHRRRGGGARDAERRGRRGGERGRRARRRADVNGAVAPARRPRSRSAARSSPSCAAGTPLRDRRCGWFVENGDELRIERSLELVTAELRRREPVDDAAAEHWDALERSLDPRHEIAGRTARRRGRGRLSCARAIRSPAPSPPRARRSARRK